MEEVSTQTDVEVIVGGISFKAPRLELIERSQYFRNVLSNKTDSHIYIEGIKPSTFAIILNWCQTSQLEINEENCTEIYAAADLLCIPQLLQTIQNFLREMFMSTHPALLHRLLRKSNSPQLQRLADRFLTENFRTIVNNMHFLKFNVRQICSLLSSNVIESESEKDIMEAGLRWLVYDLPRRQKYAKDIVSCIRFSQMTDEELVDCYEKPEYAAILDMHECLKIFVKALLYKAAARIGKTVSFMVENIQPRTFLTQNLESVRTVQRLPTELSPTHQTSFIVQHAIPALPMVDEICSSRERAGAEIRNKNNPANEQAFDTSLEKDLQENKSDCDKGNNSGAASDDYERDSDRICWNISEKEQKNQLWEQVERRNVNESVDHERQHCCRREDQAGNEFRIREGSGDYKHSHTKKEIRDSDSEEESEPIGMKCQSTSSFALITASAPVNRIQRANGERGRLSRRDYEGQIPRRRQMQCSCSVHGLPCEGSAHQHARQEKACCQCHQSYDRRSEQGTLRKMGRSIKESVVSKGINMLIPKGSMRRQNSKSQERRKLIFIIGGLNPLKSWEFEGAGSTIFTYFPMEETWSSTGKLPEPRHHAAVALLGDRLYVIGGCNPRKGKNGLKVAALASTLCFHQKKSEWKRCSDLLCPRIHHSAVAVIEKIYVIGGHDQHSRLLASVECYDPAIDQWNNVCPLRNVRMGMGAAFFRQRIWICGGITLDKSSRCRRSVDSIECYDLENSRWEEQKTHLTFPRCFSTLVTWEDKLLLIGGATDVSSRRDCLLRSIRAIDIYFDGKQKWERIARLRKRRHSCAAAVIDKYLYIIGGVSSSTVTALDDVECFDLEHLQFVRVPNLPVPLSGMGVAVSHLAMKT